VANTAAIAAGTDAGTAAVPGYATGTNSAPPGMAWVGENGPELMQMGGGERIYPADISRRIASRMAGLNIPSVLDSTSAAAAAVTPASGRDLGTVHLNVGGQAVMLQGEADALNQIQMLRVKRGRNKN
jgi:phage-related tail protein